MTKFLLLTMVTSSFALAQPPQPAPGMVGALQQGWRGIRTNLARAAEKMPEDAYSFKATAETRTFAAWVGHATDSTTRACAQASGDNRQPPGAEKSATTKADAVKLLNEALDYCDKVYGAVTEESAAEKLGNAQRPRSAILYGNIAHQNEHYGSIAVYLRLKGLVPPSTEGRGR
jgi:uncharacterized damage-inducible protein DinB